MLTGNTLLLLVLLIWVCHRKLHVLIVEPQATPDVANQRLPINPAQLAATHSSHVMYLSCSFCSVPKVRTTLLATRASSAQAVLDASTS